MDRIAYFASGGAAAACRRLQGESARPDRDAHRHEREASLHGRQQEQKNPLAATPDTIADGKEAFSHYCVACHGMDGQNTGVPFADRMSPPVPSLASRDVQDYTDGQLKWVIDYGIWPIRMPGAKGMLSDDEIWSIVVYLRHLPPRGQPGRTGDV